ncbi:ParA family protein [Burkholderia stagnalis]|uniref:ParA family protein n=1 Tax=Burkholderia stagnalis TaxID=1503054 RepID=UPI0009BF935F|nr:AAA family ATPase [Burkholderia stagnalis]
MTLRFDESLGKLAAVIEGHLGRAALESGRALRDVTGRLAFFVASELEPEVFEKLESALKADLGAYARSDRLLACKGDFGVDKVLGEPALFVPIGDLTVRLVDRRLVGGDWLRTPRDQALPPPRFVFASLKGGVGRSTALAVTAAHLAKQGKRILIIDLDMEAPGLGAMLLDSNTTPAFGVIDALVENAISGLDPQFMADLVGPSALADRAGRIDVIPAFGKNSLNNPGDVLSKIARAYTEDQAPDGGSATILDQVRALIDRIVSDNRYDAVLVDARAGLHETTPAAILGLGATRVFLFGLNEPQTFQGYQALFAHIFRLIDSGANSDNFLSRLVVVHAKASKRKKEHAEFVAKCVQLLDRASYGVKSESGGEGGGKVLPPAEPFSDVPWDDEISDKDLGLEDEVKESDPLVIFHDERFMYFDPDRRRQLLDDEIYSSAYGEFLDEIDAVIERSRGGNKNANS